jgi:Cu-Zn family superoxide dismutase
MKKCSNNASMNVVELISLALQNGLKNYIHPSLKDKKKLRILSEITPDYHILTETLWISNCDCYSRIDLSNNKDYFRIQLIRDYDTNKKGFWRISDIFLLSAKKHVVKAICHLTNQNPDNPPGIYPQGYILFEIIDGISGPTTKISGNIIGLIPNRNHAIHIHRNGNMSEASGCCMATCDHYNPTGQFHGGRNDSERHFGDLGNLKTNSSGEVEFSFKDDRVFINGDFSIIGRSIVIHLDPDDNREGGFPDSHTTGHAGKRIACGVIGIMEENTID